MTAGVKSGVSPVVKVGVVLALLVGAALYTGVDVKGMAEKGFSFLNQDEDRKEACFAFKPTPKQRVKFTWSLGSKWDQKAGFFRDWEHCEDATSGQRADLEVRKTVDGDIKCWIFLRTKDGDRNLNAAGPIPGRNACIVSAVVP